MLDATAAQHHSLCFWCCILSESVAMISNLLFDVAFIPPPRRVLQGGQIARRGSGGVVLFTFQLFLFPFLFSIRAAAAFAIRADAAALFAFPFCFPSGFLGGHSFISL